MRRYKRKHANYHEEKAGNMPIVEACVLALHRLIDGRGDELYWLMALRRIAVELERRQVAEPRGVKEYQPEIHKVFFVDNPTRVWRDDDALPNAIQDEDE